jgi:hypothetical protein
MGKIDATEVWVLTRPRRGKGLRFAGDVSLTLIGNDFHLDFSEADATSPLGKERGIRASVVIPKEVVGRMVMAAMAKAPRSAPNSRQNGRKDEEAT